MAKKEAKRDPLEKARKRLDDARTALQEARDERARVKLKGEQAVEQARRQSAELLSKATKRVELRASDVEKARQELLLLREAEQSRSSASQGTSAQGLAIVAPKDETAADLETE